MRARAIGVCLIAAVAGGGIAASMATAATKPPRLVLRTKHGALPKGAAIELISGTNEFTTPKGVVIKNCGFFLQSELTLNGAPRDKATIKGGSIGGVNENTCASETPQGSSDVVPSGFPWPVVLRSNGTSTIKGTTKVRFEQVFFQTSGLRCKFEASKVSSTFTVGGPVELHTSQVFLLSKSGNGADCPKEGTLKATFLLFSNGEMVESELG